MYPPSCFPGWEKRRGSVFDFVLFVKQAERVSGDGGGGKIKEEVEVGVD